MLDPNHEWNVNFKPPLIGFFTALVITLVIYFIAVHNYLTKGALLAVVLIFSIIQALVQLVFFLQLGIESKPRWNLMTFFFMVMVVTIVIGGSLWIMHNIDYNLMPN